MTDGYTWDKYQIQENGIVEVFTLAQVTPHRVRGYLNRGGRKLPGWFVHVYRRADPIAKLPHTMSKDEAQDAAKLILLSLKESS